MTSGPRQGDPDRPQFVDESMSEMRVEGDAATGLAALAALRRARPPAVPQGAAERIEARIRAAWDEVFGG